MATQLADFNAASSTLLLCSENDGDGAARDYLENLGKEEEEEEGQGGGRDGSGDGASEDGQAKGSSSDGEGRRRRLKLLRKFSSGMDLRGEAREGSLRRHCVMACC